MRKRGGLSKQDKSAGVVIVVLVVLVAMFTAWVLSRVVSWLLAFAAST